VTALSADALETELRRIGAERYYNLHPFHRLLHSGRLDRGQVQAWALNRYCYQAAVPRKDLALMSRMTDPAIRRAWRSRVIEHDGSSNDEGGIERWLRLTDGLGLKRAYVVSMAGVLPAVRFAVEAYVHFAGERTTLESIASSLTELFAPQIHEERISGMLANYDFISDNVMQYFRRRLVEAPKDVAFALDYVRREARTAEQQQAVLHALRFKCDMLWAQLDALHFAYVEPGHIAPGAFIPADRR
jgi:pyrroloquinoline-quinone synthase